MKKIFWIVALCTIFLNVLAAATIDIDRADQAANFFVNTRSIPVSDLTFYKSIELEGRILAYVYQLKPVGYIVISADDALAPILAYSMNSTFDTGKGSQGLLEELLCYDITSRLDYQHKLALNSPDPRWDNSVSNRDFFQYPPEGYSPTGGWLKTNWTQNAPYNNLCPMDPVTNSRSIAGCPAVAMAMIVNYHQSLNGIEFSDVDDYYHNYAGRTYTIDDDCEARDFPSFTELNALLGELSHHYRYQEEITSTDKAALVWACAVACKQVFSSSGSGTFSVNQAYAAYDRFDFEGIELLDDTDTDVYTRIAQNIMEAKPVHLAIVTPAWDAGHNVVVDGYNTDSYYHLNFGWGGTYNGWYLLPTEIPYNLTVLEGAVVDINPKTYLYAFPDSLEYINFDDVYPAQTVEVLNVSDDLLTLEACEFPPHIGASMWTISTNHPLPHVLNPGESMFISLAVHLPVRYPTEEIVEENLRLIHNNGVVNILVRFNTELITANADEVQNETPISISCSPNPFQASMKIGIKALDQEFDGISVYNLKGQLIRTLSVEKDSAEWDGKDQMGNVAAKGIYFLKLPNSQKSVKILKL